MNVTQKEKEDAKKNIHVFLSYSLFDKEYAHKLHRILSQRFDYRVFTTELLSAGEDWKSKLKDELLRCDIFVVLLSSNSLHSGWVLSVLGAAWALNKPIILVITHFEVILEIPMYLRKIQTVEFKYLEAHPEEMDKILSTTLKRKQERMQNKFEINQENPYLV